MRCPRRIEWIGCIAAALLLGSILVVGEPEPVCLFFDDFDDPGSGWETLESRWQGKGYRSGEYALWENLREAYLFAWAPQADLFPEEFSAVAVGYKYAGTDDVDYGIIWGHDDQDFYAFRMTPDGWYRISVKRAGTWQEAPISWTRSADIYPGVALRVTVRGGGATLFIGEREQATFALSMSGPWKVGLYASSQTPRMEVRFVSFGVYELEME